MAAVWVQTNSVFSCFPARTLPSCNGYEKKKRGSKRMTGYCTTIV